MAYATQEQLKYLSDHMKECRKHAVNKYRMVIVSDSNESGKKNAQIMQSIYPEGSLKDTWLGYKDLSIEFTYMWQRDQAVTDINTMVGGYRKQHFQADPPVDDPIEESSDVTSVTEISDDDRSGQSQDMTLYVVIGVAVVIIALLLIWDPKK